ncbi:MAG: sugar phosphate isomerase/epimerase [Acidihalobacter sp.]|uniref:sugar phosphate isomerase/epimerase family protein n=1 Tax=Acidihalobacter sp. TaxID=1872108 RepID=UPI00307F78FD
MSCEERADQAVRNRLGIHALVWTGGWNAQQCRKAVMRTAECGYDLIEIPLLNPASVDVAMTRRVLDEAGLSATCSLGLGADTDISSENPEVAARGERLLNEALSVARDVGAGYLGGVIFGALHKYSQPISVRGRNNALEVLRRLADRARASDMVLGLEVVNRYESNMLNTAEQALEFLDDLGETGVGVHLDTYHMNIEEADFIEPVRLCGERLCYVHVGESHRGYLGAGTVDFEGFFGALREIGYSGTITFESFSSAVVDPVLSNTLAIWRDPWRDSVDLAQQARAFVLDRLRIPASV